jgi:hypothetical protein
MPLRRLAAAAAAAASALAAQPALAATPTTFPDASRDAGSGVPDLTTVVVSNDDTGVLRFRVNVANQQRLARRAALSLYLDTDRSRATGDPLAPGADYRLLLDGAARTFELARWDGTRFDPTAPRESVRLSYWSGLSFSVHRRELGDPAALDFWIVARGPRGSRRDAAPERGVWTYALRDGGANPPEVEALFFQASPAAPRAGSTWQLRVDALRVSGTARRPRPHAWRCRATLGGKALRGRGARGCTFRLPHRARGKRLVVAIVVAYRGTVVTGVVSHRVR